jgi:rhodanese-related sulfurtransferase
MGSQMRFVIFALLLLPSVAFAAGPPLTPDALVRMQQAGQAPLLLDVRTPAEYSQGHIAGALNIPVDQVAARHGALGVGRDREVVVYCQSGKRAARARQTLESLGYSNVRLLEGSVQGWKAERRPLLREGSASTRNKNGSHE